MTPEAARLPEGFEALESFAAIWAVGDLIGRDALRGQASPEARAAFYAAASPLLEAALDHLDAKPTAAFDDREQRLMSMMLTLAHVALAEEIQGADEPRHAHLRSFMPIAPSPT